MVIRADQSGDVVSRMNAFLVQNPDTVRDAVREFGRLCPEVGQGADGIFLGVIGHQVPHVEILTAGVRHGGCVAQVYTGVEGTVGERHYLQHPAAHHRPIDLMSGLNIRRDGGLFRVQRLVVIQNCCGEDSGIRVIVFHGKIQLLERTEHAVGDNTPELALFNLHAAGEQRVVFGHGDQVPLVDIPGSGDNLNRLRFPHVDLTDPHVVGVRVALQLDDASRHHIFQGSVQYLCVLHLGAGERHRLRKLLVVCFHLDELI